MTATPDVKYKVTWSAPGFTGADFTDILTYLGDGYEDTMLFADPDGVELAMDRSWIKEMEVVP